MRNRPTLLTDSDRVTLCRIRKREKASLRKHGLLAWQHDVLGLAANGRHEVVLASAPRGSGKSLTCARLVLEALTVGGVLHEPRGKVLLVAASRAQAGLILEALVGLPGCRRDIGLPHGREGFRRLGLPYFGFRQPARPRIGQ